MDATEFLAIPPDGKRYELINGEFIVHSTPPIRHQFVLGNVLYPLHAFCKSSRVATVFLGPLDVHLSTDSVVEPDALVVCSDRTSTRVMPTR
jgi:Uma2 family endonuclease